MLGKLRFEYDNKLNSLNSKVIDLGKKVNSVFSDTVGIVQNINFSLAKDVMSMNVDIDGDERDIENECMKIISLQRPFAFDLRLITGYMKLISDLGRVADHCADICEIILTKNISSGCACQNEVVDILKEVFKMFGDVLKACTALNISEAKRIYQFDDLIDKSFSEIIFIISSSISKNVVSVRAGTDLMFIAKYAERMGDRCVNICQWMKEGFFPSESYFE